MDVSATAPTAAVIKTTAWHLLAPVLKIAKALSTSEKKTTPHMWLSQPPTQKASVEEAADEDVWATTERSSLVLYASILEQGGIKPRTGGWGGLWICFEQEKILVPLYC